MSVALAPLERDKISTMHLLVARLALPTVVVLPATGAHWSMGVALAAVLLGSVFLAAWSRVGGMAAALLFGGIAVAAVGLVALGTVVPYLQILVCTACVVAILIMGVASLYVDGTRFTVARG